MGNIACKAIEDNYIGVDCMKIMIELGTIKSLKVIGMWESYILISMDAWDEDLFFI